MLYKFQKGSLVMHTKPLIRVIGLGQDWNYTTCWQKLRTTL